MKALVDSWIEPNVKIVDSNIGKISTWIRQRCEIISSKLGNGIFLGYNCQVNNATIDDCCMIGTTVKIQGTKKCPIVINSNCWISAGVVIKEGVNIGEGSVLGAGAYITEDIPPFSIVIGRDNLVVKKRECILDSSPDFSEFLLHIRNTSTQRIEGDKEVNYTVGKDVFISAHMSVGQNVSIGDSSILMGRKDKEFNGGLVIGNNVKIGKNVSLEGAGGITIGSNCTIEDEVIMVTTSHDHKLLSLPQKRSPINIGNNVYIGNNSIILPGVNIGSNCKVLPNSIVTKDVDDNAVVVGVPAKLL